MSDHEGRSMVLGFVLGAVAGAGAALLMAPASGRDTRKLIKEKAQEYRGKAGELTDSARGRIEDLGHAVRVGARDLAGAVKEGRDAFQKSLEEPVHTNQS